VCRAKIKQRPWRPAAPDSHTEPGADVAETAAPPVLPETVVPEAVVPEAVEEAPLSPLPLVAAATARYDEATALRKAAAHYATALLAAGDAEAALPVLTAALSAPGDEPDGTELLLLRARAAELTGSLHDAVADLLGAAVAAGAFPADIPQRIHDLLDRSAVARQFLLDNWAADGDRRDALGLEAGLLQLHAAVLEGEEARARDTLRSCAERSADGGAAGAAVGLLHTLAEQPTADDRRHLLLAGLFQQLGELDAALPEAARAEAAGPSDDGDVAALTLQAKLLGQLGRTDEAARRYWKAGEACYWRDDYDRALSLLNAAKSLSDDPGPRWIIADCRRIQASRSSPVDKDLLDEALQEWKAGWRIAKPAQVSVNARRVRALIEFALADNDTPDKRRSHIFAGIAALEDLVALDGEATPWDWAWLTRLHREFPHIATAVCTVKSLPRDQQPDPDALLEDAWLALMTGASDAAKRVDRYNKHESATDDVRGALMFYAGQPGDAIAPLKRATATDPNDIDNLCLLGHALRRAREEDGGQSSFEQAREVWERRPDKRDPGLRTLIADVTYRLGDYAGSAALIEDLVPVLAVRPGLATDAFKVLGLARLAQGDGARAREALTSAVERALVPLDLEELADDLGGLAGDPRDVPSQAAAAGLAAEFEAAARAAAARLHGMRRDHRAALAEQRQALLRPDPEGNIATACYATTARLEAELKHAERTADAALEVLRRQPKSPGAAARLIDASDQLLRDGKAELVRSRLEAAVARIPDDDDAELAGKLQVRLALAAALSGAEQAAEQALSAGLAALQGTGGGPDDVVGVWRIDLGDPRGYWRLRHALGERGELAELADRCLTAMLRVDESDDDAAYWPTTTPIAVEIADDLVPEDTSSEGPMIGTYIPQMRGRVLESISGGTWDDKSAWIPGVRVRRDSALGPGRFRVLLSDVVHGEAGVPVGMVFCLASAEQTNEHVAEGTATVPTVDPVTQRAAAWVPAEQADKIAAAGIEAWRDPLLFVFRELEHQLLRHLDAYLSLDEVTALRDGWTSQFGEAGAPEVSLQRLTAVVRALVRERVPVTDGIALLRAVAAPGGIDEAVDQYRQAVAASLPGNEADMIRVRVPPKLAALASVVVDGELPAADALFDALAELRGRLAEVPARVALVTVGNAARRAVHGFVSGEYPDVPVLSEQEASARPATAHTSAPSSDGPDAR